MTTTAAATTKESPANGTVQRADPWDKEIEYTPFLADTPIKLSVNLVLRYLCKPTAQGKLCTREQALKFVMLCMARKLNPWEGDAFLVGYDAKDGAEFNLITAHQAFLKRAEAHPQFDGMESGVVVIRGEEVLELEGDLVWGDDVLIGGWAKVYRRDREIPTYRRLKLATFNTGRSRWAKDPAGMIVKCTEGDALRSAFPNTLGGMYAEGELDDRPVRQTPQERVSGIKAAPAIGNGSAPTLPTHTPREMVVRAGPEDGEAPAHDEAAEPTPIQEHARALEDADTPQEVDAAYQAAFADPRLSKSDKFKIGGLRDQRKAAMETADVGGPPAESDMRQWDDENERARLEASK